MRAIKSPTVLANHDNRVPPHDKMAFFIPASHAVHHPRFDDPSLSYPNYGPYEVYHKHGESSHLRDGPVAYSNHDNFDPYERNAFERSSIGMKETGPFRSFGVTDGFSKSCHDSSSRQNHEYSTAPHPYGGQHVRASGFPQINHQAMAQPSFIPRSPLQSNYDGLRRPNFDGPVSGCNNAHIRDARSPQLNDQDVWQSSYQESRSLQRPYDAVISHALPPTQRPSGTRPMNTPYHNSWHPRPRFC